MIDHINVILLSKITGASGMPRPTQYTITSQCTLIGKTSDTQKARTSVGAGFITDTVD